MCTVCTALEVHSNGWWRIKNTKRTPFTTNLSRLLILTIQNGFPSVQWSYTICMRLTDVFPSTPNLVFSDFRSRRVLFEREGKLGRIKGKEEIGWKGGDLQVGVAEWELSEPFGWLLGSSKQKLWDRIEEAPAYWWSGCNCRISPPGSYSLSHWRNTIRSFVWACFGLFLFSLCRFPPVFCATETRNRMHTNESMRVEEKE